MKTLKCIATALVIFIMTVLLPLNLSAQHEQRLSETIAKGKITTFNDAYNWEVIKVTSIRDTDTLISTGIIISFINVQYAALKDLSTLSLIDKSEAYQFINDVKSICNNPIKDLSLVRYEYQIDTYENVNKIFFINPRKAFFVLNTANSLKLVEAIEPYIEILNEF